MSVFMDGSYIQNQITTASDEGTGAFPKHFTLENGRVILDETAPAYTFTQEVDTDGMGSTVFGLRIKVDISGSMRNNIAQLVQFARALTPELANSPFADATMVQIVFFNGTGTYKSEFALASEMNILVPFFDKLVEAVYEIGSFDEIERIERIVAEGNIPVAGCTPTGFVLLQSRTDAQNNGACVRGNLGKHYVDLDVTFTDGHEEGNPFGTPEEVKEIDDTPIQLSPDSPLKLVERTHSLMVYAGTADARTCKAYAKRYGAEFRSMLDTDPVALAKLIAGFALTKSAYAAQATEPAPTDSPA